MKKIIRSLLIALTLIIIAPLILGFIAKRNLNNALAKVNLPKFATLSLHDYQQGWWSSQAQVDLLIKLPAESSTSVAQDQEHSDYHPIHITGPITIAHGPVLFDGEKTPKLGMFSAKTDLYLHSSESELQQAITKFYHEQPQLKATLTASFQGDYFLHYQSPKVSYQEKEQTYRIGGLEGHTILANHYRHLTTNIDIFPISLAPDNIHSISLSSVKMVGDFQKFDHGLWLGDTATQIHRLEIQSPQQNLLRLGHLYARATTKQANTDRLNTRIQLTFNKMIINDQKTGPFTFQYQLNGLHIPSMVNFNNYLESAEAKQQLQQPLAIDHALHFAHKFMPVINKGIKMILDSISLKTPDGTLDVSAHIHIPAFKLDNMFMIAQDVINHAEIQFDASASLELSKKLINLMPTAAASNDLIAHYEQQHLIQQEGNNYTIHFNFQDGKGTLNGASIDLLKF